VSSNVRELDSLSLVSLCADDTQNTALWSEFVRRFAPKIKQFISGTLRQSIGSLSEAPFLMGGVQENDLFQNTILRLVENNCAALRRFSGTSENDFHAYLAVISRSAVRDFLRRQRALKRPLSVVPARQSDTSEEPLLPDPATEISHAERNILAREIVQLSEHMIRSLSGETSERDWLIFQFHYYDDMPASQIAQCKGIDLSKAGVEKVLSQLKERVRAIVAVDRSEAMIR
jgi:RNA polymerase sigma factor (sigma-70 family)